MRLILLNIVLLLSIGLFAQKENKYIRKGNKLYEEKNYKDAEVNYMKALDKNPASKKGQFNLGDALYKQDEQKSYEDAAKIFSNQADLLSDKNERSDAYYNLGNSLLKAKKYPESIEAYKKALRNNPRNMEAKYNMEYAKKKLEQQQQQNKDDKKKDDKKDDKEKNDKKKDKKDQDKKDQNKKDQQKQDKEKQDKQDQQKDQKDQQGKNKDQNKQQQQSQPQQISKKDAQRMLEALKNNEKKTLEKLKLQKMKAGKAKKVEKDW